MRNYIILNGNNSNEIAGLLIQKLPPISQPEIRTNIEEIDGRDGDIITKLGYSAYNKEISIGLYGNYNVDDVIAYFTNNQNGQITFSNEPDKYYNYEILEQIDYEKLIRYRTATITLHCQPFKYSTTEEKIQINATEVTGSGSSITLNNTEDGALFTNLQINGDTSQDGTPTPSNPIEVDVVTGDNTINVVGKNLLPNTATTTTLTGVTYTINNDKSVSCNGTSTGWNGLTLSTITLEAGTYTLSSGISTAYAYYVFLETSGDKVVNTSNSGNITFTLNSKGTITIKLFVRPNYDATGKIAYPMLEKGSSSSTYEPYKGNTYEVNLGKNLAEITGENHSGDVSVIQNNNEFQLTWTGGFNVYLQNIVSNLDSSKTYTISFKHKGESLDLRNGSATVQTIRTGTNTDYTLCSATITNIKSFEFHFIRTSGTTSTAYIKDFQIEKSSVATEYSKYFTPIELGNIGDYQDKIHRNNGKWYLHKEIGKVVLNGSENWSLFFSTNGIFINNTLISSLNVANTINCISNYFTATTRTYIRSNLSSSDNVCATNGGELILANKNITSATDFQNWLSSNNVTVYYVLATPTDTEITDTTLLSQLEALEGATTYLGETNINTSGSDLSPLLDVTTYSVENPSFTITNSGNIYSKPIITIYGVGTIGLYLNGIQVLSLDMGSTTSQITIDVAKLEAYNQETGALMNRNVTGDYNNLVLNVGENTITESGTLQGLEVENYSRWL